VIEDRWHNAVEVYGIGGWDNMIRPVFGGKASCWRYPLADGVFRGGGCSCRSYNVRLVGGGSLGLWDGNRVMVIEVVIVV